MKGSWPSGTASAVLILGGVLGAACFSSDADPTGVLPDDCAALARQAGIPDGETVVGILDFAFVPATVTVEAGERITWVSCEPAAAEGGATHTTTADDGRWDSPLLARGEIFQQVIGDAGSFTYHCAPHPFMTGTVVVE